MVDRKTAKKDQKKWFNDHNNNIFLRKKQSNGKPICFDKKLIMNIVCYFYIKTNYAI